MTRYKRMLLGATASAALLGGAPAYAFEIVDWTWDKDVTETVTITTTVTTDLVPDGLVQVEKLQMHFGNLNATSNVASVHNNPGTGGGGTVDELFDAELNYIDGSPANENDTTESATNAISGSPATVFTAQGGSGFTLDIVDQGGNDFGNVDENAELATFQLHLQGTLVPEGEIAAVDLPKVENAATAVANNQSISADVPIYLHDAQFAAGAFTPTCSDGDSNAGCPDEFGFLLGAYGVTILDNQLDGINEHTSIAGLLTVAAATGFIEPASITASATVSDVLNAYVENSATAVTNNASFSVLSGTQANHIVVADLTQWGYANVGASASVGGVTLDNYTGFGAAGLGGGGDITPIVSNSATAVGNNLSIKVGSPAIDG